MNKIFFISLSPPPCHESWWLDPDSPDRTQHESAPPITSRPCTGRYNRGQFKISGLAKYKVYGFHIKVIEEPFACGGSS